MLTKEGAARAGIYFRFGYFSTMIKPLPLAKAMGNLARN